MNIVWHKWQDVMRELAATQGLDLDLNQIEAPTARRYAQAINAATEVAWKFHAWPGCCWVWEAANYHPANKLEPGFDVLALYEEDPIAAWVAGTDPKRRNVRETQGRYVSAGATAPTTPYYLIRTAPPRFGTAARDTATAYEAGQLIYDSSTGEAWRCVRAHTNQALPASWEEWAATPAFNYTAASTARIRRAGVLWDCSVDHDDLEAGTEPGYGANWTDFWSGTPHYWAPQRIPGFLLHAIIHGARSWLHESPPLPRSAMEKQMEGWLAAEVNDLTYNRSQRFADGGGLTML